MLRVRSFALSAVGADRPGIIAAIAERLVAHGLNVTDSQMGILRGFFAMTLVRRGAQRSTRTRCGPTSPRPARSCSSRR